MALACLPPEVTQHLVAGEVITGPPAAVKELVENALDAGASSVRVEVRGGGLEMVRVTDDGCGIPAGEVELAFGRFTTSKVRTLDDLRSVSTLGFRGEALACLAALASVEMVTRARGAQAAVRVRLEGGRVVERAPAAHPVGTTVTAWGLLADRPHRRLPVRQWEAQVREVVRAFALAHPGVRFELWADGRRALATSGTGDLREAVAELFGPSLASLMAPLGPLSRGETEVTGLVSRPPAARPDRGRIYLSVNGRPVRTASLLEAVEAAARPFFPKGRFPVAAVHLRLPPWQVDVNLTPAKDDVRLRAQEEAVALLREAVRRALHLPPAEARGAVALLGAWPAPRVAEAPPRWEEAPLRPLGQLLDTFLLAEGPQGLYIVDQHRAHERAIYDRLLAGERKRRPLEEPIVLELKPHQAAMLERVPSLLEGVGFSLEAFGRHHFLVREVPQLLEGLTGPALEEAVLEALQEEEGWVERLLASLACRMAVRRGRRLGPQEVEAILAPYQRPQAPTLCPHGGPIALVIGREVLSRQLGLG